MGKIIAIGSLIWSLFFVIPAQAKWCYNSKIEIRTRYIQIQEMVPAFRDTFMCRTFFSSNCYYNKLETKVVPQKYNYTTAHKECCQGYTQLKNECVAICSDHCYNGFCSAPEVCSCIGGYEFETQFKCRPVCSPSCENGTCIEPNECQCHLGYHNISNHQCQPTCANCDNGNCVAPNNCVCNTGFEKDPDGNCTPVCKDPPCINGMCIAPQHCECNRGFEHSTGGHCEPVCDPPCQNSNCSSPGICTCLEGYFLHNSSSCSPICEPECVHGTCKKPNECVCDEGFVLNDKNTCDRDCAADQYLVGGECVPMCRNGCKNAVCRGPDECECSEGYKEDRQELGRCIPVCENPDCTHGHCIAPNECQCLMGFRMGEKGCDPVCDPQCVNGDCESPDTCKCHAGFMSQSHDPSICVDCDCPNGFCTDGQCTCFEGYFKLNYSESCEPKCDLECPSSICVLPNVCLDIETTTTITEGSIVTEDEGEDNQLSVTSSEPTSDWGTGQDYAYNVHKRESGTLYAWLGLLVACIIIASLASVIIYKRFYKTNSFNCTHSDSFRVDFSK